MARARRNNAPSPAKGARRAPATADDSRNRSPGKTWLAKFLLCGVLALFVITRLWLLLDVKIDGSDLPHYARYALYTVDGHYSAWRDFDFEYPPVALWVMETPRYLDSKPYPQGVHSEKEAARYATAYTHFFHLQMGLVDVVCLVLMCLIGWKVSSTALWVLPGAYTLMTIAQPHLLYDRLDLVLLMFFLFGIYCWLSSLDGSRAADWWGVASYFALGLGISYKVVPIFFIPFLQLADFWAIGKVWKIGARILALLVAAAGPFLIYAPAAGWNVLSMFRYHGERDIHLESIWASLIFSLDRFGVSGRVVHGHGAYNLIGPWSTGLKITAAVLLGAMLVFFSLWALLRGRRFDRRLALDCAELVVINFVVLGKVFSPQYLNWALPLALLLAWNIFPRHWIVWTAFVLLVGAILGISAYLFPSHYAEGLMVLRPLEVNCAIARSALLIALGLLLNVAFFVRYGLVPWRTGKPTENRAGDESEESLGRGPVAP